MFKSGLVMEIFNMCKQNIREIQKIKKFPESDLKYHPNIIRFLYKHVEPLFFVLFVKHGVLHTDFNTIVKAINKNHTIYALPVLGVTTCMYSGRPSYSTDVCGICPGHVVFIFNKRLYVGCVGYVLIEHKQDMLNLFTTSQINRLKREYNAKIKIRR